MQDRVYKGDTALVEASIFDEDGVTPLAASTVEYSIRKPDGRLFSAPAVNIGETLANITFNDTSQVGQYLAQVTFTLPDSSRRSSVLSFEVVDPLESSFPVPPDYLLPSTNGFPSSLQTALDNTISNIVPSMGATDVGIIEVAWFGNTNGWQLANSTYGPPPTTGFDTGDPESVWTRLDADSTLASGPNIGLFGYVGYVVNSGRTIHIWVSRPGYEIDFNTLALANTNANTGTWQQFFVGKDFESAPTADAPEETVVDRAWMKLEDLFDSELGGPHLRDRTMATFNRDKMKRLIPDALFNINNYYQPVTSYNETNFPYTTEAPLLSQALLVESVRHLMRSYTEQPLPVGMPTYFDRRDYLNRWQIILQMEEDRLNMWLDLFKRGLMGFGHTSVLVGGYASYTSRYPRYMRGRYPYVYRW